VHRLLAELFPGELTDGREVVRPISSIEQLSIVLSWARKTYTIQQARLSIRLQLTEPVTACFDNAELLWFLPTIQRSTWGRGAANGNQPAGDSARRTYSPLTFSGHSDSSLCAETYAGRIPTTSSVYSAESLESRNSKWSTWLNSRPMFWIRVVDFCVELPIALRTCKDNNYYFK